LFIRLLSNWYYYLDFQNKKSSSMYIIDELLLPLTLVNYHILTKNNMCLTLIARKSGEIM